MPNPIVKDLVFYKRSTKSKTAGYDKWVFYKHSIEDWFLYKNTRTNAKIRVHCIKENDKYIIPSEKFWPKNTSFSPLFHNPGEYFSWIIEKFPDYYSYSNSQFKFEYNQIIEKYPEYFI